MVATKQDLDSARFELENNIGDVESRYGLNPEELTLIVEDIIEGITEIEEDDDCGPKDVKVNRVALNLNSYKLFPIIEIVNPTHDSRVITDRWWQTYDDHVLVYTNHGFRTPQCNQSKEVAEKFLPHGCEVTFLSTVYLPN